MSDATENKERNEEIKRLSKEATEKAIAESRGAAERLRQVNASRDYARSHSYPYSAADVRRSGVAKDDVG